MTAGTIDRRLDQLDVELPTAAKPVANFIPCVQVGSTLYVSGQVTAWNGELRHVGKVGREISLEEARTAARLCALNVLAQQVNAIVAADGAKPSLAASTEFVACAWCRVS